MEKHAGVGYLLAVESPPYAPPTRLKIDPPALCWNKLWRIILLEVVGSTKVLYSYYFQVGTTTGTR